MGVFASEDTHDSGPDFLIAARRERDYEHATVGRGDRTVENN